ncbi:MAG: hypothetical protein GWP47_14510 [Actinobacteria bacterium]|nr:hypothetical protein [Actinomycetota bacterium]NCG37507.1 hypothetical protein [Actinomycetota bacterium]
MTRDVVPSLCSFRLGSLINFDRPYNERLVRDVGALNLALGVVVIAAFVTLSKQLASLFPLGLLYLALRLDRASPSTG